MRNRRRIYRRYCKSQNLKVTQQGYALWLVKVIDIEEEARRLAKGKRINLSKYPSAVTMVHGVKQTMRFFKSILPSIARDKLSSEAQRFMKRDLLRLVKLILEYTNSLSKGE